MCSTVGQALCQVVGIKLLAKRVSTVMKFIDKCRVFLFYIQFQKPDICRCHACNTTEVSSQKGKRLSKGELRAAREEKLARKERENRIHSFNKY